MQKSATLKMLKGNLKSRDINCHSWFFGMFPAGHRQQPVTVNDRGVALVSGASPNIFAMVAGELSPYQCMLDVIESERYAKIAA